MNDNVICEEIMTLKQVKRKRKNKDIPEKITSSFTLAQWMSKLIGSECQEHLIVVCLDTKNQINSYATVSIGSLNQSVAHPRDILQRALLSNSARIAIVHNHPSGHQAPSRNDDSFTERIANACGIIGIDLLDHIIVTDSSKYFSYKEEARIL
ncbi:JAB domain-containing protein [Enterococcus sp. DIV0170]|uniref:JAB domain-containing protein n=1 Tax=Enterococcus sp. DIV0170 TaxID=2774642 RepID=UPI003F26759E